LNNRCLFRVRALAIASTCAALTLSPTPSDAVEAASSADISASSAPTTNRVWSRAQDLALFALGLIGVDYRFGGNTPEAGLDCSGLVRYVFQQVTGIILPRTSFELSRMGKKVTVAELKVGDLVFFNTRSLPFSHVGIYLGDDRFVHAPSRGREVEIVSLSGSYWRTRFDGARRPVALSTEPQFSQDAHAAGNASSGVTPTAASAAPLTEIPAVDTVD
jgi:cell wall-associated NlpC family hydrolase